MTMVLYLYSVRSFPSYTYSTIYFIAISEDLQKDWSLIEINSLLLFTCSNFIK